MKTKINVPYVPSRHLEQVYITEKGSSEKVLEKYAAYLKSFKNFILQEDYPCIGARTAVNSKAYALGIFEDMDINRTARLLAQGLTEYLKEMSNRPSDFLTYVALFPIQQLVSELQFENFLWKLLNELHRLDAQTHHWSPDVSNDPTNMEFSFSFGGEAFFIVGMHPLSSRKSRRYKYVSLAFNLHKQFENLRRKGRYSLIKNVIRDNDVVFSGSVNPMLSDFGKGLEAPQYSGRKVSPEWKCPFMALKN